MSDAYLAVAALGCALIAGFLFAFSVCVMRALKVLPHQQGIAAMQSINIVIINPWFLLAFFGVAVLCVISVASAVMYWGEPRNAYALAAGLIYLLGTIGITMGCNVPLNQTLAAMNANSAEAEKFWASYLKLWTRWNHVRMLSAVLAAFLFISPISWQPT